MKRNRFSEEQTIGIVKEHESGDLCRKHGVSSAAFYKWKARYGGLEVSQAAIENENAKLKKLLAEAMLDNAILKDAAAKNGNARRKAGRGGACRGGLRDEPAPGVQGFGRGPIECALSQSAPGGR